VIVTGCQAVGGHALPRRLYYSKCGGVWFTHPGAHFVVQCAYQFEGLAWWGVAAFFLPSGRLEQPVTDVSCHDHGTLYGINYLTLPLR
jgi:hypothetical protein